MFPLPIYSFSVSFFPSSRHNTSVLSSHLFPVELLWFIFVPNLCAHRDRESRPPEPGALYRDTCSGVRAIRFLGSVFRDCSLPRIGEIGYFLLHQIGYFLLHRLLPGGRSRDCTTNIFLHRLWSATSSNALCRLVRMEPPVPSALVPPLGTILNDCILFSVCLQYLQCLSLI